MSRIPRLLAITAVLALIVFGCSQEPPEEGLAADLGTLMEGEPDAPDLAQVAPEHSTILYADELVTVSRLELEPGETVPEHQANHRLLVATGGAGQLEVSRADTSTIEAFDRGEVRYVAPGEMSFDNTGEAPLELLTVTRTGVILPTFMEQRVAEVSDEMADTGEVLLSNDHATVRRLELEPGASAELPAVPIRVVYPAGASALEYQTAAGDAEEITTDRADAYLRPGDDHTVVNRGDETATVMVFEWLI